MPRFEHDGISHYFTVSGKGFPLIFVHGLGLSHQGWLGQVPVFARRYKVITYDCRGHGGTGPSRGQITIRHLSEDLHALMEHIGVEKAVLVGYSSGTLICQQFAMDYPDRTAGLCLIGSFARVKNALMKLKNSFGKLMVGGGLDKLAAFSVARNNAKNVLQRGLFYRIAKQANPEEGMRIMEALDRFAPVEEVAKKLTCPLLFVHGSRDLATEAYARSFAALLPGARIAIVDGANHAVATKKESEFNALLDEWLQTLHLPSGRELVHR
ncbi:MAG TPA: alpha/beta hydrolase [Bacilli bacterium]|nr:alpha/beta hydrolase [Bacilli bacterium]